MSDENVMVTHIDREEISEIIGMRGRGLSKSNIAQRMGINYTTLCRYIRVYDRYGRRAFAPARETA